ncbi:NADP-dependent phosphogluconate dehydrogenase [Litoreibacter janthinus]|uniref:6-phosphogluconate dehydrogenase, decarboxylating n=1 Tax=Litoreibacter janthinus TaxID=670154 RepID=A0A1I6FQJ8_9RHOB|nr:NADP-dependent phosphogluconate dehydrogenase [Litoreibacter janthinus]SFR32196.1 6-phosphogluconate dehydrogenase (decarboxylating) [Litoreibacter janthinus]
MSKSEIGLIGLGTMGAMLSLNIAEKGHAISVFNRTTSRTSEFYAEAGNLADRITPCETLEELVASIAEPRAIILMVPAGKAVDQQIAALRPLLGKDDLIIDAGNANFRDTEARAAQAEADGVPFLGIGVSGGEEGARHGPSIMGGGRKEAWDQVAHILTAIAADYEGTACATWMGQGGAGHFVKAVHNGIEYADMQMIAEVYGIMRDGQGASAQTCASAFETWNKGPLQSYLIEISGKVAAATDDATGNAVLDIILDRAGQKGTGRWTVIEAQHLGAPVPVIEAAVAARNLSAIKAERARGEATFGAAPTVLADGALSLDELEKALIAGKIMCYAQGFHLLNSASAEFKWDLPMPDIARVWREGCIIRSTMLNDMADALTAAPQDNLMFAPYFADMIKENAPALRKVVATALSHGLQVPALAAGLGYYDAMRTARSTANMIQAQRDFFGAHSFERVDQEGAFHGPWGS